MRSAHTVEQVREAERARMAQLPEGALMQAAAHGLAHAVLALLGRGYGARVLVLAGSGDNGGDALYAGAVLARRGVAVEALLLSPDKTHAAALAALTGAGGRVVAGRTDDTDPTYADPDVVVDGIVGIGGRPGLKPEAAAAVDALLGVPVVAVDVPSGVDVDTGGFEGPHVEAAATVTFGTHKVCHLVDPAAHACGAVHLVDLGLDLPPAPVSALQEVDAAALLPQPGPHAHKYTRGVVGVRAGSATYPGAAVLCVAGAGGGLAGMVRYDGSAADAVRAARAEVVAGAGRVQAWVVGSGAAEQAGEALARSLADGVPLVVDADALTHLDGPVGVPALLTPHAGELARMLGTDRAAVESAPLHHARAAARDLDAVVLLKGRRTLVAAPDGAVRVNVTGTPWLATAGAGDVLSGLAGALLAAGLDPYDAGSLAAWVHGAAATRAGAGCEGGPGPVTAGEVAAQVPAVLRTLAGGAPEPEEPKGPEGTA